MESGLPYVNIACKGARRLTQTPLSLHNPAKIALSPEGALPDLERYRWLIVAIFAAPLLIGIGFLLKDRTSNPQPLDFSVSAAAGDIRVYVTGAVKQPGIYPLDEGTRWIDALNAAGGPAPDADLTAINLAKRIQDEDKIVVPRQGEVPGASPSIALVNINTASQQELESLSGIGEVRAGNIIKSRNADGPFATIDDLIGRKLVPQSVYENISAHITTGP